MATKQPRATSAERELKKSLRGLADWVVAALAILDEELGAMQLNSADQLRAKKLARLATVLEYKNDQVRHFTLGLKMPLPHLSASGIEKARHEVESQYEQLRKFTRRG